ncbi:MAG: XRE family transcriptional regulator [Longimicrobiales bacterium]|nr:XRE family transcriptional regulator [Longimicrobiales bacterium]
MKVGAALRRRRNELGMTLRELAGEAELTSGFLSQVENDRVSPSLKSLGRIAEVLHIPLFQLLSTNAGNPVVRSGERVAVPWMDTGVEVVLLTPYRDWQMLPFHRTMAPGERLAAVRLEAAREEWYYVLTGAIEITLTSDEHFVLEEGDAIHFESSQLHEVANPTKKTATFICMMTPPQL